MNLHEFKILMDTNQNAQFIIAGMVGLVDDGFTPHEVFDFMRQAEKNTFHSLMEIHKGEEGNDDK